MQQKFIITATQRSGTAFLESALNRHPEIYCYGEALLDTNYSGDYTFYHYWLQQIAQDPANITLQAKKRIFGEYLDWFYTGKAQRSATGFDIKYDQYADIADSLATLQAKQVKVIHLVRRNVLKTLISSRLNVQQRELNRKSHDTERPPVVRINLPADSSLVAELQRRKNEINHFSSIFKNHFDSVEICYEDLVASPEGETRLLAPEVVQNIFDFLQLTDREMPLQTGWRKTNPNVLTDVLENYDQVADLLTANGLSDLLDEAPAIITNQQVEEMVAAGKLAEAVNRLQAAVSAQPDRTSHKINLGVVLWQQGRHQASLDIFSAAYKQAPADKNVVLNLATILHAMNLRPEAAQVLQGYDAQFPQDADVQELLKQVGN
jgi:predicted Zn-dependent protease